MMIERLTVGQQNQDTNKLHKGEEENVKFKRTFHHIQPPSLKKKKKTLVW